MLSFVAGVITVASFKTWLCVWHSVIENEPV